MLCKPMHEKAVGNVKPRFCVTVKSLSLNKHSAFVEQLQLIRKLLSGKNVQIKLNKFQVIVNRYLSYDSGCSNQQSDALASHTE